LLSLVSGRIPLKEEPFSGIELCRSYDEHARRFMMPVYRDFVRKILKRNPGGNRILDIGTGSGLLAIEFFKALKSEARITGIDISEDMLSIAHQNAVKAGLGNKIDFKVSSAAAMPFSDGSFDLVISNASLHHWIDPQAVCSEIKRVTVKGGFCFIRDNMRLSPIFNPLISLISYIKGMNEEQHNLWIKAIQAGYTVPELKALLKNTGLQKYQVTINPAYLDLNIQCLF
jgi:ubiquinone/menaquinone biosynthesis C-methylase UbiE